MLITVGDLIAFSAPLCVIKCNGEWESERFREEEEGDSVEGLEPIKIRRREATVEAQAALIRRKWYVKLMEITTYALLQSCKVWKRISDECNGKTVNDNRTTDCSVALEDYEIAFIVKTTVIRLIPLAIKETKKSVLQKLIGNVRQNATTSVYYSSWIAKCERRERIKRGRRNVVNQKW